MEDAQGSRRRGDGPTAAEIEVRRKRESLEMSRRGVERDLRNARTEAHRAALENALRFLDDELGKLG